MKQVDPPILVSACLLGVKCAYDGEGRVNSKILSLLSEKTLIPVCPEQLGGLTTPRAPSEIQYGTGNDVLEGNAKVISINNEDMTPYFLRGARETLRIAQIVGATDMILRPVSPSCGFNEIYDGTFSESKIVGDGVTAALLKKKGFRLIDPSKK